MKKASVLCILSGLVLALLSGCPLTGPLATDEQLQQAYQTAINDAEVAEPDEISTGLTAIVPHNDHLIWQGAPGASPVLMVTWTSWTGYDSLVGKSIRVDDLAKSVETSRDTWVTAAPQLREFCRRQCLDSLDMTLRVEQLMGLPPHNGKTRFVAFWVNPEDLFRPSPDPEISDREAELDFPASPWFVTVSPEHVDWFNSLRETSYGTDGYPWTRLGYTYDWGNPFCEIGLSEFVIRSGATIDVQSVTLNDDFWK
jgi:hypothetical protein